MKAYFYDFFDTIVHRRCTSDEIKKMWAQKISDRYSLNIYYKELYNIRKKEEVYLSSSKKPYGEFTYSELCTRIYMNFTYLRGTENFCKTICLEDFLLKCIETESEIEFDNQYVDTDIVNEIKQIKNSGRKVYIISDFYMPSDVFQVFLEKHQINKYIDGIFVSCDSGYNKYSGSLFKYAMDKLGIQPNECCMKGDNKKSDYEMPKRLGISSEYTGYIADKESIEKTITISMNQLEKINVIKNQRYGNYAFALYLFIDRLYRKLKSKGYKKVYFFSREGEMLKRIFDKYIGILGDSRIQSEYLYVSRKSTFMPILKNIETETFDTIFCEFPNISVVDFLGNLNMSDESISKITQSIDFDERSPIVNFGQSHEFDILKTNEVFVREYNKSRDEQNVLFGEYLYNLGIDRKSKSIAVVDVGWKGTIQDNIFQFLDGKVVVDGFYIGILSGGNCCLNNNKYGLLFNRLPYESYMFENWSWDHSWFERLMFASHGSTDSYIRINGKVLPKLKEFKSEKDMYSKIQPIQMAVEDTFVNICEIFKKSSYSPELLENEFLSIYLRTIFKARTGFIKLQNELCSNQFENFGCNTSQAVVEKERFSAKNMWTKRKRIKEAILKFGKTNDVGTICRVLSIKRLYILVKIIYRYVYIVRKKQLKK